ncbi:hypothetical protein PAPHI01_2060 [Pancytospora philotis]|nr:hypothetical protein PAPHI01_2060 [Pancytospora philotis]
MEDAYCRICYLDRNPYNDDADLISPCACKGSMQYIHAVCLNRWRFRNGCLSAQRNCETCAAPYARDIPVHYRHSVLALSAAVLAVAYLCFFLYFGSLVTALSTIRSQEFTMYMGGAPGWAKGRRQPHDTLFDVNWQFVLDSSECPDGCRCAFAGHESFLFLDYRHWILCLAIFISASNVWNGQHALSTLNYAFTFWRYVHFGFAVDKALFGLFTLIYLKDVFWLIYYKLEWLLFNIDYFN